MVGSANLVGNFFFQFFTWASISGALLFNVLAFFLSKHDRKLGNRMKSTFFPTTLIASYWWLSYSFYFFGCYSRATYTELIHPVAPLAFIIVWTLPAFSYYFGTKERLKKTRDGV